MDQLPEPQHVKVQAYSMSGDPISPVVLVPAASKARHVKQALSEAMGVSVKELDLVLDKLQLSDSEPVPVGNGTLCLTAIRKSRLSDFLQQKRLPSLEAPSTVERSSSEGLNTEARAADGSTALHLAARQGELGLASEILNRDGQLANVLDRVA
eukprot:g33291.t1